MFSLVLAYMLKARSDDGGMLLIQHQREKKKVSPCHTKVKIKKNVDWLIPS